MLLVKVRLDPKTSNKKQLIHHDDVSAIADPDPAFDAPYPSCDVDGGNT